VLGGYCCHLFRFPDTLKIPAGIRVGDHPLEEAALCSPFFEVLVHHAAIKAPMEVVAWLRLV
jgi:hypothetical protein